MKKNTVPVYSKVNAISQEVFGFDLEPMGGDGFDFFDSDRGSISIWALRKALEKAYAEGAASVR